MAELHALKIGVNSNYLPTGMILQVGFPQKNEELLIFLLQRAVQVQDPRIGRLLCVVNGRGEYV